jgi:trimethylamine--corrinoid protein Co-methyltransferase
MDCDQLGAMARFAEGVDVSPDAQAMDAIAEVGPGGHFLGCAHTQAHFENAFYRFDLHDNNSVEQWEADGALEMPARANARWKKMLATYEAPPLDIAIRDALEDYVARRKSEMPDATH